MIDIVKQDNINGQTVPSTTSLKIAEVTGKEHFNVIRDIENLIAEGEFNDLNFEAVDYKDKKGELRKMYILDETFTTVLLMGFTGKEAVKWKIAFTKEFPRMREELKNKVLRAKGDEYTLANDLQKKVLDAKRKELEGKDGHIGLYVQIARRTNELAFGYHEKDIRQNMNTDKAMSLNKAFKDTFDAILDGVTNPSKIKETVEAKRLERSEKIAKLKE